MKDQLSGDFYKPSILPYAGIIIKICQAYTDTEEDFEDYYQEVCLQIWKSKDRFQDQSLWSIWVYRLTLNTCLTLILKSKKRMKTMNSAQDIKRRRIHRQSQVSHSISFTQPFGGFQESTEQ